MITTDRIRSLVNRLARLDAGADWEADINPAQRAALDYLVRANSFSRSPSVVADYLGNTRGTVSQTLKSLARKGFVAEERSTADKRSISYRVTDAGLREASRSGPLAEALFEIREPDLLALANDLEGLLRRAVRAGGNKPFGICRNCLHFRPGDEGGFCSLLSLPLETDETTQICHEQEPA
ncbi:MarR family winged helix-turn-helix transcriptional regulator [Stappia sp. ES.058]|uniref:MarR family winged helix-turn-helix transcriptional regulator n=1 Tax=Stappia sp. ES.058 TaxID=1881061 RepID=UPI00087BC165|nr:MarR family transcriptional regulator [Stappia sp. ES.058]SDU40355.1 transcriptional regulator, MarR family [Stappia sp. ES.058]